MPKELAKQYAPQGTEDRIYQNWCDKGYFHTQIDRSKKPFTIVMPPPNVTGQLHMGHAMDETWQDILTRYKRMQGYAALWVPGTDHASIATEAKVVAKMREEGLTKEMVGRDGFLAVSYTHLYPPLLPPVGVWAVSQSQCGRSTSQSGYQSSPWWAVTSPTS